MTNKTFLALFLVTTLALSSFGELPAPFKAMRQFSADQVMTSAGKSMKSKIFVDGEKTRFEMEAVGQQTVTIARRDKKVVYMLMPTQKMYMEMPSKPKDDGQDVFHSLDNPETKIEAMGAETVKDQACDKYKITSKENAVLIWISSSTKFPVRMASEDGRWMSDWENFKDGAQPAELFEPPADYKKMDIPGGMPAK